MAAAKVAKLARTNTGIDHGVHSPPEVKYMASLHIAPLALGLLVLLSVPLSRFEFELDIALLFFTVL